MTSRSRDLIAVVAVVAALFVAALIVPESRILLLGSFVTFVVLASSLDLQIGRTGMLAMGHAAYFGAGAYISTILYQETGIPLLIAGFIAVAVVATFSYVVGFAAVSRTVGLYFAIVTFAIGQLLVEIVNRLTPLTGGSEGMAVEFGLGVDVPFGWSLYRLFTVAAIGVLLLTLLVAVAVRHSQFGLRLQAVRESETLARGLGFTPSSYKALVMAISSTLAALAGVVYAPMVGFINPEFMNVEQSIYILGLLVVGGMNSLWGPFVGVALLSTLPAYLQMDPTVRPLVVGAVMAIVVLVAPGRGFVGLVSDAVKRFGIGRRTIEEPADDPREEARR